MADGFPGYETAKSAKSEPEYYARCKEPVKKMLVGKVWKAAKFPNLDVKEARGGLPNYDVRG
jgi:hypothetical protein